MITTSGGGALLSDDGAKIEHARKLSTQAREPAPHYEHTELGFNYRLSNLLAAVGRAQLEALPERVETRRRINARYRELLPGVEFMPEAAYGRSNCWLTCILVDEPERIRQALEAEDIEARPLWKPMHLQPFFAGVTGLRRRRVGAPVRARALPPVRVGAGRRRSAARSRRSSGATRRLGAGDVVDPLPPALARPVTVSLYAFCSSSVTGPTPISWSSIECTGVISTAVPAMKTSSAM